MATLAQQAEEAQPCASQRESQSPCICFRLPSQVLVQQVQELHAAALAQQAEAQRREAEAQRREAALLDMMQQFSERQEQVAAETRSQNEVRPSCFAAWHAHAQQQVQQQQHQQGNDASVS